MSSGKLFPHTRQSVFSLIRSGEEGARRRASDALIQGYWRPIYKYLRLRWSMTPEDAQDATQLFFLKAIEKDYFASYDPARARFRTFLRTCIDRFMMNERKAGTRLKRGGALAAVPISFEAAEEELGEFGRIEADPDEFFYREWVRGLLTDTVLEMEKICRGSGRQVQFELFRAYDLENSDPRPTYRELAERFFTTSTQVTNYLAWSRGLFRRLLVERLRELTGGDEEFRAELGRLLGGSTR